MEKQEWTKLILAIFLAIFGCVLLVVGLVCPPLGIIDNTVIVASGEVFVFSASVLGIHLNYDLKYKKLLNKRLEDKGYENKPQPESS